MRPLHKESVTQVESLSTPPVGSRKQVLAHAQREKKKTQMAASHMIKRCAMLTGTACYRGQRIIGGGAARIMGRKNR